MTAEAFIRIGLKLKNTTADKPFANDFDSTILRHIENKKWFALVYHREGKPYVNLKCEPMKADFWRGACPAVTPAWHMNKSHWNTVDLMSEKLKLHDLTEMLSDSYRLTAPRKKAAKAR